ncbi:MAG: hypothetical protein ABJA67_16755 [Chthonomonadales bacterium]
MVQINKATELLSPGESAVVVLTDGRLFQWNSDDTGTSGNWKFNPNGHQIVKVIVYYKFENQPVSDILIGNFEGTVAPQSSDDYKTDGRLVIKMSSLQKIGITRVNWKTFADAGANPVRFLP